MSTLSERLEAAENLTLPPWTLTVFDLEKFIEFAENHDPDLDYSYTDGLNCPIAQFLGQQVPEDISVEIGSISAVFTPKKGSMFSAYLPDGWDNAVSERPYTWGDLTERLMELEEQSHA